MHLGQGQSGSRSVWVKASLETGVAVSVLGRSQFSGLRLRLDEGNTKDTHTHVHNQLITIPIKTLSFNLKGQMASHIARMSILLPGCVLTPEYSYLKFLNGDRPLCSFRCSSFLQTYESHT